MRHVLLRCVYIWSQALLMVIFNYKVIHQLLLFKASHFKIIDILWRKVVNIMLKVNQLIPITYQRQAGYNSLPIHPNPSFQLFLIPHYTVYLSCVMLRMYDFLRLWVISERTGCKMQTNIKLSNAWTQILI